MTCCKHKNNLLLEAECEQETAGLPLKSVASFGNNTEKNEPETGHPQ
jgi:hypothetical protein